MAAIAAQRIRSSGQRSQRSVAAVVMTEVCPDGKECQPLPPWNGENSNTPSRIQDGLSPSQLSGHVRPNTILISRFTSSATITDRQTAETARAPFGTPPCRRGKSQEHEHKESKWPERL